MVLRLVRQVSNENRCEYERNGATRNFL